MARYSASVRTGAGSTTTPIIGLQAAAAVALKVREIGVFNTTTTAVALKLVRTTTAGTATGLTEETFDTDTVAASGTGFAAYTGDPTLGDEIARATLGAAAGAGMVWTFDAEPIRIPVGTANGICLVVSTGTGQVCDAYVIWDE
jgi:hypothetical protein